MLVEVSSHFPLRPDLCPVGFSRLLSPCVHRFHGTLDCCAQLPRRLLAATCYAQPADPFGNGPLNCCLPVRFEHAMAIGAFCHSQWSSFLALPHPSGTLFPCAGHFGDTTIAPSFI